MSHSNNGGGRVGSPARAGEIVDDDSWAPRRWIGLRTFYVLASAVVLIYSAMVLGHVAWMGTIGVRCMFGTIVEEEVSPEFVWRDAEGRDDRPSVGDALLWIDGTNLEGEDYSTYIQALRGLGRKIGEPVEVGWRSEADGQTHVAEAVVRHPPTRAYLWSIVWFLQELFIFGVGARVFWRRPNDDSARLFFLLCIVTVGAFMGGYHWTEIVLRPSLIYPFAFFAILVPAVNLHFYMVFPRPNPLILVHRRWVLGVLYGVPAAFLAALWGSMYTLWRYRVVGGTTAERTEALEWIRHLALSSVWMAVVFFGLCFFSLVFSYRRARNRGERNQVKWILLATAVSTILIGYLMGQTLSDPANLGRDSAAWPMFTVSLLYTIAHAFSITRYKLLQVEEIFNRSVAYFILSVTVGLIYSVLLLVGGKVIGDRLAEVQATSWGAVVAAASVILVLIFSEIARGRFQRVLDRRFFREKYKFDQAMQKMKLAVGSLVDRATLGRRLLEGTAEVLRLEWGALYLADAQTGAYELAACHGPTPDDRVLSAESPLVARLRQSPSLRYSHAPGALAASAPAADAMIAIGGEAACAIGGDGELAGVLVLGPKRSGAPYEEEEMAFLGALGSVAALALHSADIQRTLEDLNRNLRDKVEKIAAQQQRILILQDQLRDRAERELAGRPGEADPEGSETPEEIPAFDRIKGSSSTTKRMLSMARKVAASSSAVLIRGESGTGKELLAAAVHAASPRADRPFVQVHCAALSQALLESELFGHVKGAFTGADRDRVGRFEQADGGTLFLDEIGDINLEVQTKLLRVLQEMAFERVGSSQTIHVDVRIIAATHQDLEALIDEGKFREDLFYRLNVIRLTTPPLRDRREDVLELALHFLDVHAAKSGKVLTHIDPEAVEALLAHDWPGNVRELENTIERAVVLADGPSLSIDDFPQEVREPTPRRRRRYRPKPSPVGAGSPSPAADSPPDRPAPPADEWTTEIADFERQRLAEALEEAEGNKSVAARSLGMPRSTFFSKLKKHGMA